LRKIPVLRLYFPGHSAREIVRLSTGIFRKYSSQTWYICIIYIFMHVKCYCYIYHHWIYKFESHSWRGVLYTTLCDKVCQWLAVGRLFSLATPVSSTNKTDHQDITEILLKVALNTISLTLELVSSSYVLFKFPCHARKISAFFLC
jgi:hypothetical protein